MVANARNNLAGLTKTESVLKLFEDKLRSSTWCKNPKSVGKVQKSLEAMLRILRFAMLPSSKR